MKKWTTPPAPGFAVPSAGHGADEETWIDRLIHLTDEHLQRQAEEEFEHDTAA
jgi:hypothetical protein